ncbi:class I SAM-dependent DNA methyltransferase [Sphaerisporangium rufum]|nr:class I SAM-dependent methyltransferase [Sphaerisporangium rufum]
MSDHGRRDGVRRSYDAVAEAYAARFGDELAGKPLDRALLAALAEQAVPDAPVADLGCGPGHVAAWLAAHGMRAVGVDLSPAMVAAAARAHPDVEFREGDLVALPAGDGEFGAAVAFYSIIHLGPGELPAAFAEVRRTLLPGAPFLLSFHIGTEVRHLAEWLDQKVDVDFRFYQPDHIIGLLADTGFAVQMWMERVNHPAEVETCRAYLLAHRQ